MNGRLCVEVAALSRTKPRRALYFFGPTDQRWGEPFSWPTKLDPVSGKGNHSEEKEILPEISANGRGANEDVRKRWGVGARTGGKTEVPLQVARKTRSA